MLYADRYLLKNGNSQQAPVIDYQKGSLRDDFYFGSLLFFRSSVLKQAVRAMDADYRFAGLYDLRLRVSELAELVHVNEYLYSEVETDIRKSGEKLFDYVDPKNRAVQIEMEAVCTAYLKRVGGYLAPDFEPVTFDAGGFEQEASVIIPVRNRIRTIEDAICSVLAQKTTFRFNLIIVDNHSTDGTSEAIGKYTADGRVVHLVPERSDLGIGGCWNVGVHHPACGKFAVQLDSDDVYSGPDTLQKIVDAFYEQNCAMVVGTYRMTDFKMTKYRPASLTIGSGRLKTDVTMRSASTVWELPVPFIHLCSGGSTFRIQAMEKIMLWDCVSPAPGVSGASMMSFTSAAAGKTIRMPRSMS